jgi:predicted DNA-binding WGR domain protein
VPAKRQTRFYRLAIWPDLFGGFSLAREYGRIGQAGHLRLYTLAQEDDARSALVKILGRKRRRGYVQVERTQ